MANIDLTKIPVYVQIGTDIVKTIAVGVGELKAFLASHSTGPADDAKLVELDGKFEADAEREAAIAAQAKDDGA